jgi:hypothetical protein
MPAHRAAAAAPALVLVLAGIAAVCVASGCRRAPGQERQPIGARCTNDAACGDGDAFHCATDHPGGYCEIACRGDRDCPRDAVCVGGGFLSKGDCHRRCGATASAASGECRVAEGYACVAAGDAASHDYCDPPGRSDLARRLRGRGWRW